MELDDRADKIMRIVQEVPRLLPVEAKPASAGPGQDEEQERQSDCAGLGDDGQPAAVGQSPSTGSAADTTHSTTPAG